MLNIEEYISSGIVESYVLGISDEKENLEFERFLFAYPQLQTALQKFELELENQMKANAFPPPARVWNDVQMKIEFGEFRSKFNRSNEGERASETVIPIVSESTNQLKVHKNFRYAFIALVVLSKVFLYFAIYYYLLYKDELRQKERLQHQIQQTITAPKPS
ncbi:MAG: hypothetical protein H7Y03_01260 [Chitinophagaceae bacterium]|nr:hypothetical protein [Chitinophagaceae bacterium]